MDSYFKKQVCVSPVVVNLDIKKKSGNMKLFQLLYIIALNNGAVC